jgi:hypothetical protein
MATLISFSGNSVNPASGTPVNFSTPQTYTVTAADGTTQTYTVTVNVALASDKAITVFNITSPVNATGAIDEAARTVGITVPYGTAVNNMTTSIAHTGASISPAAGTGANFTSPITYTVTAADGSTQAYTVTVRVAANPAKAITAFAITSPVSATGVINGTDHTVTITVPYGTTPAQIAA